MPQPIELADVFRRHGEAFRQNHAGHLSRGERRVMGAVAACRTAALGGHVEQCDDCGAIRIAYNSCRNRHCPKCQWTAREAWLEKRKAELLPVPYFHVVFTLPPAIAGIAFQNKARVYAILFRAAAEALRKLAADPRHLGAELGILAVLHTWGQTLQHHPHVHCVIPGGGPSLDGTRWVSCNNDFFLPVRPLSRLFRGMFLDELRNAFRAGELKFFGDLAHLSQPRAFAKHRGPIAPRRPTIPRVRDLTGASGFKLWMTAPPPDSLERLTHAELVGVVRDLIGEVTRLRAENEKLSAALAKLRIEHQAVKDELARLKGLPPRPPVKPSGMDKSTDAREPETGGGKKRSSRRRGSQLDRLKIGATVVVKADPPAGSRNKG